MYRCNMAQITIQDCLDMQRFKDEATILEKGQVVGFTKEVPDGAATPIRHSANNTTLF